MRSLWQPCVAQRHTSSRSGKQNGIIDLNCAARKSGAISIRCSADHIGGKNGDETALGAFFGHSGRRSPDGAAAPKLIQGHLSSVSAPSPLRVEVRLRPAGRPPGTQSQHSRRISSSLWPIWDEPMSGTDLPPSFRRPPLEKSAMTLSPALLEHARITSHHLTRRTWPQHHAQWRHKGLAYFTTEKS
jgi:hypothetical protein